IALGRPRAVGKAGNIYVSHVDIFRFYCYPNSRPDERIVPAGRATTVGIEPIGQSRSDGSGATYRDLRPEAKAARGRNRGKSGFGPGSNLEEMPWRCHSTNVRT